MIDEMNDEMHYNLDSVISVGCRVSSVRATRFRQWTTQVLREHLTRGYTVNEHRLAQRGLAEEIIENVEAGWPVESLIR